jgi:hypothetical protein
VWQLDYCIISFFENGMKIIQPQIPTQQQIMKPAQKQYVRLTQQKVKLKQSSSVRFEFS